MLLLHLGTDYQGGHRGLYVCVYSAYPTMREARGSALIKDAATNARDYFDTIRRRYNEYQAAAQDNQLAIMRYYTPAGHEIRVLHVTLYEDSGTLLLRGEYLGSGGQLAPCDVVIQPQSAQLLITLATFSEPPREPERQRIGFRIPPKPNYANGDLDTSGS